MASIQYNIAGAQLVEDPDQDNGYILTYPLDWKDRRMLSTSTADITHGKARMRCIMEPFDFNQVAKCDIFWVQTYYHEYFASDGYFEADAWGKNFVTVNDEGIDLDTARFGDLAVILSDAQGEHICTFLLQEPEAIHRAVFGDDMAEDEIFTHAGHCLRAQMDPSEYGDTPDDDEALVGLFTRYPGSEHFHLLYYAFTEDYKGEAPAPTPEPTPAPVATGRRTAGTAAPAARGRRTADRTARVAVETEELPTLGGNDEDEPRRTRERPTRRNARR